MPRHGIGQQVQRSSAGSIPHDRITIPQICSSRSLPLDRPRQSALRYPAVAANRPTIHSVRRDPRLIQQPFHRPPACWSASTPFTHLIRGTQIPIAQAAPPTSPSRGFLPWRFAYAGPRAGRATFMGPPSANLHRSGRSPENCAASRIRASQRFIRGTRPYRCGRSLIARCHRWCVLCGTTWYGTGMPRP